jgi:RNA polymerase sigma-70 factor (ECF subfamily)
MEVLETSCPARPHEALSAACRSLRLSDAHGSDKNQALSSHSDVETIGDTLAVVEFAVESQPSSRAAVNDELKAALRDLTEGRRDAVERIWDLIADDLYGLALWRTGSAADAEDAVQEVFLRLSSTPAKFGNVQNPRSYLLRMTHNAAHDAARRRESPMPEIAPNLVAVEDVDAKIDGRRASDFLIELPVAQREVVFLRHFVGLSFREIGEVCRIPTFTAASRNRLAIRRLKELLGVES